MICAGFLEQLQSLLVLAEPNAGVGATDASVARDWIARLGFGKQGLR